MPKTITVLTPCFNEENNVREIYERVRAAIMAAGGYAYEHIFIDNCSSDGTVAILTEIARRDHNVKLIVNARNFGHIRSPMHALLQAQGEAVISIVADFQDPNKFGGVVYSMKMIHEPAFPAAEKACESLDPNDPAGSGGN